MAQEQLMNAYKAAVNAHQQQDLVTALSKYLEVLALNPNIAAVHNNVAAIRLTRGEKPEAEASWREAVKLKPEYAEAHYNLAVLLSEKNDADLAEAERHCRLAIKHKEPYTSAFHLMGNILMSLKRQQEATIWYERASSSATAMAASAPATDGSATSQATSAIVRGDYRWDGVEVGHVRTLKLPDGTVWRMQTLSMHPLAFLVEDFLSDSECETLIELSRPKLKASLMMGDASASERTSESVFLATAEHSLLGELQQRLGALAQLPPSRLHQSEDLQVRYHEPYAIWHASLPSALTSRTCSLLVRWCTTSQVLHSACITIRPPSCPAT